MAVTIGRACRDAGLWRGGVAALVLMSLVGPVRAAGVGGGSGDGGRDGSRDGDRQVASASSLLDGVAVELVGISERRSAHTGPASANLFTFGGSGGDNALTLTLAVSGRHIERATHYGRFVVLGAEDDRGRSLSLHDDFKSGLTNLATELAQIDRGMMFFAEPDAPKDRIRFDVQLALPERDARRIARFDARVAVRVGDPQSVSVSHVRELVGKRIAEPALHEAGLDVQVVAPGGMGGALFSGEPDKSVSISVAGDVYSLLEVGLVDGRGRSIDTAMMWSVVGDATQYTLMADRALPADAGLELNVARNGRLIEIPLSLRDVTLP